MNEEGMNVNLSFTTIYIKTLNKKNDDYYPSER